MYDYANYLRAAPQNYLLSAAASLPASSSWKLRPSTTVYIYAHTNIQKYIFIPKTGLQCVALKCVTCGNITFEPSC